jgi:hypothetical protein
MSEFKVDMLTIFRNCMKFNDDSSELYSVAYKLEKLFWEKMSEGVNNSGHTIRIM